MNRKTFVVLSAAFGGISPNLFRLALSLTREGANLPGWSYLLGLLIFAMMGAVVALIWEETNLKKAFYLGIGLPAFIQMSAGEISSPEMAMSYQDSMNTLAAYSHAAERPYTVIPVYYQQEKQRKLEITLRKFVPRYTIVFTSADSSSEEIIPLNAGRLSKALNIPAFAAGFKIKIGDSESQPQTLPREAEKPLRFEVFVKEGLWGGFLKAIGVRGERDITITVRKLAE